MQNKSYEGTLGVENIFVGIISTKKKGCQGRRKGKKRKKRKRRKEEEEEKEKKEGKKEEEARDLHNVL